MRLELCYYMSHPVLFFFFFQIESHRGQAGSSPQGIKASVVVPGIATPVDMTSCIHFQSIKSAQGAISLVLYLEQTPKFHLDMKLNIVMT